MQHPAERDGPEAGEGGPRLISAEERQRARDLAVTLLRAERRVPSPAPLNMTEAASRRDLSESDASIALPLVSHDFQFLLAAANRNTQTALATIGDSEQSGVFVFGELRGDFYAMLQGLLIGARWPLVLPEVGEDQGLAALPKLLFLGNFDVHYPGSGSVLYSGGSDADGPSLNDYCSRGLECLALALALQVAYPEHVTVLRGMVENRIHEAKHLGSIMKNAVSSCVHSMAAAAYVESHGGVLCMAGGLSPSVDSLDHIRTLRLAEEEEFSVVCDLIAGYPDDRMGWGMTDTGDGYTFGEDISEQFCFESRIGTLVTGTKEASRCGARLTHENVVQIRSNPISVMFTENRQSREQMLGETTASFAFIGNRDALGARADDDDFKWLTASVAVITVPFVDLPSAPDIPLHDSFSHTKSARKRLP